jgi:histidinol-phosphate/aromatic aminotransferase/cobyric acid decarboxylase-like protein
MIDPVKTVYSWHYPEVAELVAHAPMMNGTIHYRNQILSENLDPGLDDYHLPFVEAFKRYGREQGVIGWDNFPYVYPTNGSSEALFHLLANYVRGGVQPIQVEGDYQGYVEYSKALGGGMPSYTFRELRHHRDDSVLFLSNPSARDGNRLSPVEYASAVRDHRTVLDLAYLGMTDPLDIDISGAEAVVCSMSKPFGMYYYRVGLCFSQFPIPSLEANRWFKNVISISTAQYVLEHIRMAEVRERYRSWQEKACQLYQLEPSDVWLLGYKDNPDISETDFIRYANRARYCLTPYFMNKYDGSRR